VGLLHVILKWKLTTFSFLFKNTQIDIQLPPSCSNILELACQHVNVSTNDHVFVTNHGQLCSMESNLIQLKETVLLPRSQIQKVILTDNTQEHTSFWAVSTPLSCITLVYGCSNFHVLNANYICINVDTTVADLLASDPEEIIHIHTFYDQVIETEVALGNKSRNVKSANHATLIAIIKFCCKEWGVEVSNNCSIDAIVNGEEVDIGVLCDLQQSIETYWETFATISYKVNAD